jgi:hypothetical protein
MLLQLCLLLALLQASSGYRLSTRLFAKGGGDDAVTRRRNRRSRAEPSVAELAKPLVAGEDGQGEASLEDMFGLGNDQLRELMEQELPVPREDLSTRKEADQKAADKNKVFQLPDLEGFMKDVGTKKESDRMDGAEEEAPRVDRSNQEEYLRVLQLNPFADADDSMFLEEYDIIPSIFGSGKLLNIPVPYLQTGHGILLIVTLLAGFVYAPGNPLTEFPVEVRNFLKQGLAATYSINAVLAVQAFLKAKSKNLPATFWAMKTFLLGGVAFYEVTEALDPKEVGKKGVGGKSGGKGKSSRK